MDRTECKRNKKRKTKVLTEKKSKPILGTDSNGLRGAFLNLKLVPNCINSATKNNGTKRVSASI